MRSSSKAIGGFLTALAPGLLGCLVLLGWKVNLPRVVQVIPGAAPMQFNTAIGFVLVSVFLGLLWTGRRKYLAIPSFLLVLLGGVTLSQYLFGFDAGIDEILHSHLVLDKTSHPGRMAPSTALCFLLIGLIGWLAFSRIPVLQRPALMIVPIFILLALAFIALTGYFIVGGGTYDFFSLTQMAIHTTIGFLISGVSLILYFRTHPELGVWPKPQMWPWIMAVFCLLVLLATYQGLRKAGDQLIRQKIDSEQTIFTERIELIEQREEKAFERLADRWAHYPKDSVRRDEEAEAYLRDFSGLRRILWLPIDENQTSRDYSAVENRGTHRPNEQPDFRPSPGNSEIPMEEPRVLQIYEEEDNLMAQVYVPVVSGEKITGYLLFTKNMTQSFGAKTLAWLHRYLIEIRSDGTPFFYNIPEVKLAGPEWISEKKLRFFGTDYTIIFLPSEEAIKEMESYLPALMLGVGLLITALSSWMLHLRNLNVARLRESQFHLKELNEVREQETATRRRLQLATSAGDIGTWEWDIAANKMVWDDEMKTLYGFDADIDNTFYDKWLSAVHPEDKKLASDAIQKAIDGSDEYICTFRIIVPDTGIHHIDAQGLLQRDVNGRPFKMYGINRDVSERIKYEKELEELNRRLVSSNKELEYFAYIASHDLQEPLRKICAFGERLMERARGELQVTHRDYLDRMVKAAHRMSHLISDLLSYSRVESKGEKPRLVDLRRTIDVAIDNLESAIESSHASVEIDKMPSLVVDPSQMTQLFQNLIANAIKFQPTGQKPEIQIKASLESSLENKSFWLIRVSDNGIGIEMKYQEKVFEIFERLHSKTSFSGSGIGLAICNKIVSRHNGTLTIESDPDTAPGTTFVIRLPSMADTFDPSDLIPAQSTTV